MATNKVFASYQEIIDLQTVPGKVTVIGVHTPTGNRPRSLLSGLFAQYRKFAYIGCSLKMANAATLPVDPLGVSGVPNTTDVMDPRDSLNPIVTHGCHGDNLNQILDQIFQYEADSNPSITKRDVGGVSAAMLEQQYYKCLSDPTWKKWGIQSGVSLKLRPLVNKVALTRELVPSDQTVTVASQDTRAGAIRRIGADNVASDVFSLAQDVVPVSASAAPGILPENYTYGDAQFNQMFTNGLTRLGYLSTRTFWKATNDANPPYPADDMYSPVTYLPKVTMSCILLPPSYKQVQYLRMVLTHYFVFKGFTTALLNDSPSNTAYYNLYASSSRGEVVEEPKVQTYPLVDSFGSEVNGAVLPIDNDSLETINAEYQTVTDGVM